jgi:hypothetical protein
LWKKRLQHQARRRVQRMFGNHAYDHSARSCWGTPPVTLAIGYFSDRRSHRIGLSAQTGCPAPVFVCALTKPVYTLVCESVHAATVVLTRPH